MGKISGKLIGGGLVLLITFNLFNFLNFLFQFAMVRVMSVADYGILAALFSMIYILGVPSESIQTILTKYSSTEEDKGKLKTILKKSLTKAFYLSIVFFIVYTIIAYPLSGLMKIDYSLMVLTGSLIFVSFLVPVSRGVLQGKQKFNMLGGSMVAEGIAKLGLSVFFVLFFSSLGFFYLKVHGAILGVFLGALIGFGFSVVGLREILSATGRRAQTPGIYQYARPVFVVTLVIFTFLSMDIILAKIVFEAELAGSYALASILGKIIFLGTQPISKAMFPLTSQKVERRRSGKIFFQALVIIILLSIVVLFFLLMFPDQIVKIFSGENIPGASSVLFLVGFAFSILSMANLVLLYNLSIGKTRGYPYLILLLLVEVLLLVYFSNNLISFSIALILAAIIFLLGSLVLIRR